MSTVLQQRAAALLLERRSDGRLWAIRDGESSAVRVARCFPWSAPARYISLRDDRRKEFCLIAEPADLDEPSRQALEESLIEADFVLRIEAIVTLKEEIEIRSWEVETAQGRRSFQTKRDDWPRSVPGGGVLIRDVAGDLLYIADPEQLDAASRDMLSALID